MSIEERIWVAVWYEETRSPVEVQRRFRARFGRNRNAPQRASIMLWHENLFKHGSVLHEKSKSGRQRSSGSTRSQATVEAAFDRSPERLSIRRAELELQLSRSAIHRNLQEIGMKPFKMKVSFLTFCFVFSCCLQQALFFTQVLQALIPEDKDRRVQFAEGILRSIANDPEFLSKMMFSDESIFHLDGRVNKQNCRIWSRENPRSYREQPLHSEKVVVWAALSHRGVIGPFFFDGNVTGENYLTMLQNFLWPQLANLPDINELHFMQDGAPPHFALSVRQWLDQAFELRWIGRRGPIEWPARSPDMTPLDFYLWGHIKQLVYVQRPRTIEDLKNFIRVAISEINNQPQLMSKVLLEFKNRMRLIVENGGGHIEQLADMGSSDDEQLPEHLGNDGEIHPEDD